MKTAATARVSLALALALLAGCSAQQLYATGQTAQRNECRKIEDRDERTRCQRSADLSYDTYKAQAEAARKP